MQYSLRLYHCTHLDLGQRQPVVDNGYYYWDEKRLDDIAIAYTTTDPSEAAHIMDKYNADYLVFSWLDESSFPSMFL